MVALKHYILVGILYFIAFTLIKGQNPSQNPEFITHIKHFGTQDGLSHHIINDIAKDERGILWLATRYGLNRFDGKSFKVFDQKNGLFKNEMGRIYPDGPVLWCLHDERERAFQAFSLFHTTKENTISLQTHLGEELPFEEKDIQQVWFVEEALIFELSASRDHAKYIYSSQIGIQLLDFLKEGEWVIQASPNSLWLENKTTASFSLRQTDTNGKEIQQYDVNFLSLGDHYNIRPIFGSNGQLSWFIYTNHTTKKTGLFQVKVDGEIQVYNNQNTQSINGSNIPLLRTAVSYIPEYDAFWFLGNKSGLISSNGELLYELPPESNGRTVMIDRGLIWQYGVDGFSQIELKKNTFKTLFTNNEFGRSFRTILSKEGNLYFFSNSGVYKMPKNQNAPYQKILEYGFSAYKDKRGDFWFDSKRLSKYYPENPSVEHFGDLLNSEIWSFFEDNNGKIWYGAKGLFCFDPKTNQNREVNYNEYGILKTSTVYHFFELNEEELLLCSTSGLYKLHLSKGIVERYWSEATAPFFLPADDFRHLYYDKTDQSFWLAASQVGLVHWQPAKNQSKLHPLHNMNANTIHAVYADDYGFLWLSTENGIIQFNKSTYRFKAYLPKDGTSSHEFNRISHFQDTDGTLYFGSINGVTIFHPKDFSDRAELSDAPKVLVVELNQYLDETQNIVNKTADFFQKREIKLNAGDRFFNLKLTLDNFSESQNTAYTYQIKNVDKDWTTALNNEISISGLPYGKQVLAIRAILENGQYSEVLEVPVQVLPPFYLKWWFIASTILAGAILSIMIILWRTRRLKLQKALLEDEVASRTKQIQEDKKVIEKQAEALLELDKTKSRFFANVSHELRTPITLIQGPVESVLKNQNPNTKEFSLLSKAKQNTQNLHRLVNEILDLTKLEAQKLQLEEHPVVFYTFLRKIIANFQSLADSKSIQYTFQYKPCKELQIELDTNKFEKVLNNLLSNAFKFTPKEGRITVNVEDLGNALSLKIQDNGRGIPAKDLPHIFNRFYQSSINKKAEGGLGIGLALSMEFVKLMNGKMWVESNTKDINQGSTFSVQFPKKEIMTMLSTEEKVVLNKDTENGLQSHNPASLSSAANITPSTNYTILLVEDNPDLRDYIQFLLSPTYRVITAENGEEGLSFLSGQWAVDREPANCLLPTAHCQLILSDVMMPIMDGFEFLEKVKANEQWSQIPVIMLTARAEMKNKLKALRIGVDDYMVKPFSEEELMVRIENLLGNYEERKAYLEAQPISNEATKIIENGNDWLLKLEGIIIADIGNPIFSVDYVAERLSINRNKLYQKVKSLTGLTPNQYFRTVRLQKAKELLETGSCKSVKETAIQVGFYKIDYFSSLYKKQFGKSPSEYLE